MLTRKNASSPVRRDDDLVAFALEPFLERLRDLLFVLDDQDAPVDMVSPEGLRPSDSPTRSLARRCAGALRSRGSLARSLAA